MAAAATRRQHWQGVDLDAVSVAYRDTRVLDDITLHARAGEILALLGPSGSGKSTALKVIAGFVQPSAGRVRIGETDVTALPPQARGLGVVVQNYALFPHMRVEDNVAFGPRARGASPQRVAQRVEACLRLTGMHDYRRRYPRELSGGQQQRVAIARALAVDPSVLLLDEPLSALDAQIRRGMVEEIARLHRDLPQLTIIYVTHDQSEALTLAERIAIMRDGRIDAVGATQQLYQRPPSRYVAEFLGHANVLPVRLAAAGGELADVLFGEVPLRVAQSDAAAMGAAALLCVRPHALRLLDGSGAPPGNALSGTVEAVLWQGEQQLLRVACGDARLRISTSPGLRTPRVGDVVRFGFAPRDACLVHGDAAHGDAAHGGRA